jgi:hypothetical protein
MRCAKCGSENPDSKRFCGDCGAVIAAKSAAQGDGGVGSPSLQLVGRLLGETTLIQTGAAFERATEWQKQRPDMSNMFD